MTAHAYNFHFEERADHGRLTFAATITVASAFLATLALLSAERLSINKVAAPQIQNLAIFAPVFMDPPKPTKPPPPIENKVVAANAGAAAAAQEKHDRLFEKPEPRAANPSVSQHGMPTAGGPPTGGPPNVVGDIFGTCVGPQCTKGPTHMPSASRGAKDPVQVSRRQLSCIACADPSRTSLRAVATHGFRSGKNVTSFCVDERGRVENARTKKSSGDRAVDGACRAAVKRWRLKPYRLAGKPQRACTDVTFEITMK